MHMLNNEELYTKVCAFELSFKLIEIWLVLRTASYRHCKEKSVLKCMLHETAEVAVFKVQGCFLPLFMWKPDTRQIGISQSLPAFHVRPVLGILLNLKQFSSCVAAHITHHCSFHYRYQISYKPKDRPWHRHSAACMNSASQQWSFLLLILPLAENMLWSPGTRRKLTVQ